MNPRRLPFVVTLILLCYVVFALAWKFSAGLQPPEIHLTRTALPTFAVEVGREVLQVATATTGPSVTPTALRKGTSIAATARSTATPTAPPTVTPTATRVSHLHVVSAGETMWGIALRYGVPYRELLDANPDIDPNVLWEGQEIEVPDYASLTDAEGARTHTVSDGETVWGIALQYEVEYRELLRVNGMDANSVIRPGDELILPLR